MSYLLIDHLINCKQVSDRLVIRIELNKLLSKKNITLSQREIEIDDDPNELLQAQKVKTVLRKNMIKVDETEFPNISLMRAHFQKIKALGMLKLKFLILSIFFEKTKRKFAELELNYAY